MRRPIIAANWKMHMTRPQAAALIEGLRERLAGKAVPGEVVIAPPFTALRTALRAMKGTGWHLAAQNVHWEEEGAFTGEVAPAMLEDVGCRFVIVGHSERRQYFHETDDIVQKKAQAVMKVGITPIICIGESLEQREQEQTLQVITGQLSGALGRFDDESPEWVIAYEPIWAIGTGKTATTEQAQEVHAAIRRWLGEHFAKQRAEGTRLLYGGSVKPGNVDDLMAQEDIDGALVGGASLKADSFSRVVDFR
jgi:triosephosphate isomerase